jgi:hypothetical protein
MEAAPLSLYLDLQKGHYADLEVVAKASLAFAELVREAAYLLDPGAEIRLELISGTPGSLGLNTIIKLTKHPKLPKRAHILAAISGATAWIIMESASWGLGQMLDWLKGPDAPAAARALTDDELAAIASEISSRITHEIAQRQKRKLLSTLAQDPSIIGAGTSSVPGKRPALIIPRSNFKAGPTHSLQLSEPEMSGRRITSTRVTLTLISPVLMQSDRRWKFRIGQDEFGAAVKDRGFVERVLAGEMRVRLKAGIEIDAELETVEELEAGVWTVKERRVMKVFGMREPAQNSDLFLAPPEDDQ